MTVVLGINLTDRVYIAADTRVSRFVNGEIVPQHDDMMKIGNVEGVVIGCAGDAGLAAHVLRHIRSEGLTAHGIDHFKENIKSWIAPICEEYWSSIGETTYATFICAGRSTQRRKWVDRSRMDDLFNAYFADPDNQGKLASVKAELFEGLRTERGDNFKTRYSDVVLFAVSVSFGGISMEEAQWGQHLVYGSPGLMKEDVVLSQISRLEFGDGEEDGVHTMLLTAYVHNLVKRKDLKGVGSVVVPVCVDSEGVVSIRTGAVHMLDDAQDNTPMIKTLSEIAVVDDKLSRVSNGHVYPLMLLEGYVYKDKDKLII